MLPKILGLFAFILVIFITILTQLLIPVPGFNNKNNWKGTASITTTPNNHNLIISSTGTNTTNIATYYFPRPIKLNIIKTDAFLFRMKILDPSIKNLQFALHSDSSDSQRAVWPFGAESERMGIDATQPENWQNYRLPIVWSKDYNFDPNHIVAFSIQYKNNTVGPTLELSPPGINSKLILPFPIFFNDPRVKNINFNFTSHSQLPIYRLNIIPESLATLNNNLPKTGRQEVIAEFTDNNGKTSPVKVHYRGDKPIHHEYLKRSWRIIFENPQKSIQNIQQLNLNVPEDYHWGTIVPYFVSQNLGLLTPKAFSVRLVVNNIDTGTYIAVEQINNNFLKKNQRLSGILYFGDVEFGKKYPNLAPLFEKKDHWEIKQIINYSTPDSSIDPLDNLLNIVNLPFSQFEKKIETILDVDSYLRWYVLYNSFNSMHNDNIHNVKMFYNADQNIFEMIAWDINPNNTVLDPLPINVSNNLLTHKLLQVPRFIVKRDKIYLKLIESWLQNNRLDSETKKITTSIKKDFTNDIFTLPSVSKNYDQIINTSLNKVINHLNEIAKQITQSDYSIKKNQQNISLILNSQQTIQVDDKLLLPALKETPTPDWMVTEGILHRDQLQPIPTEFRLPLDSIIINPVTNEIIFQPNSN